MKYKIYKLIHEDNVVYIGRTTKTLQERKANSYKGTCVELIAKDCQIELIEETNDLSRERYWINYYDELLNIQKGDGVDWKRYQKKYQKEYRSTEQQKKYQREYQRKYRLLKRQ